MKQHSPKISRMLLMEEILHHLGWCSNPENTGIFTISTGSPDSFHQPYHLIRGIMTMTRQWFLSTFCEKVIGESHLETWKLNRLADVDPMTESHGKKWIYLPTILTI